MGRAGRADRPAGAKVCATRAGGGRRSSSWGSSFCRMRPLVGHRPGGVLLRYPYAGSMWDLAHRTSVQALSSGMTK